MTENKIDSILKRIEKPSSYIGNEVNSIIQDYGSVDVSFALVFPELYEIGTSHFGLQILYTILNSKPFVAAERVYTPGRDMMAVLKESNKRLFSLETKKELLTFDVIGISLLYELTYTNILAILDLSGIPFLSKDRDDSYPLIIAGGPCTVNPEPVADFFDAMVIGDGEDIVLILADIVKAGKKSKKSKKDILKDLSKVKGIYIPGFFNADYTSGFQYLTPEFNTYTHAERTIISDLEQAQFPVKPIIPFGKPIHDRLRLEISRGCSRGCRFCQAGMIYRPVRERSVQNLMDITEKSLNETGYSDLSLLSLSTGDYVCLNDLMKELMGCYADEHVSISLPSIRAGKLNSDLMEIIKKVRKTGFTIAPEAGTQRLRDVINKGISEEQIINTVNEAFNNGWKVIKLYFMIGHPTETKEDIDGIIDLVDALRKTIKGKGKKPVINVSITTFIPKSHTPFQWENQMSLEASKETIFYLKKELQKPGVKYKFQSPEISVIEGVFSRGDRRLSQVLIKAYEKGCLFDGWSESFNFDLWMDTFADLDFDYTFFTDRKRDTDETLPWDHINTGISKDFLLDEYKKAFSGEFTEDCRFGKCSQCGVCDFKELKPIIFDNYKADIDQHKEHRKEDNLYRKILIRFSKMDQAKYFSHLELVNIFIKAFKRAGIPLKYSEGFHPAPKLIFLDTLPVGIESRSEILYVSIPQTHQWDKSLDDLNSQLPDGLSVTGMEYQNKKIKIDIHSTTKYTISTDSDTLDKELYEKFEALDEYIFEKRNKKGNIVKNNLKEYLTEIQFPGDNLITLTIKKISGKTFRPAVFLKAVFNFNENQIINSRIIKE